jgi:DNA-binding LacI/PurR family transcriptional regulator
MAWGAMEAVKTHNLKIPRDIGIAGYDNIIFRTLFIQNLTTVENPTKDLGINAANLISDALERQKKIFRSINCSTITPDCEEFVLANLLLCQFVTIFFIRKLIRLI